MFTGVVLLLLCCWCILPNNIHGLKIVEEPSLEERRILTGLEKRRFPGQALQQEAVAAGGGQARIVGGSDAPVGRYPYHTFLEFRTADNDFFSCSGSLIWQDMVLTTAHCILNLIADGEQVAGIDAFVNLHDFDDIETGVEERQIEIAIPHPDYNATSDENDIMLLKLAFPVLNIQPVMLNFDPNIPLDFQRVDVMGFGALAEDDQADVPFILQVVDVAAIPFTDCNDANSFDGQIVDSVMICAGEPNNQGGKDACFGDSGAPLIVPGDGPGTDVVVGIVSFGEGCARPDFPGAYTRVSAFSTFIVNQICDFSNAPPESCDGAPTTPPPTVPPTIAPTPFVAPVPVITTASPSFFVVGDDDDEDSKDDKGKKGNDNESEAPIFMAPFSIPPTFAPVPTTLPPFSIPTSKGASSGDAKGKKRGRRG